VSCDTSFFLNDFISTSGWSQENTIGKPNPRPHQYGELNIGCKPYFWLEFTTASLISM
jgi:hypothetical protein